MIEQPETAWSWGHPEDEAPSPPNLPYAIKGDFQTSFVKCFIRRMQHPDALRKGLQMWEMVFCLEAAEDLFCCKSGLQLPLFWPFWTYFIGWELPKDLNGISCFICQKQTKKKPFGNGAICYYLGSLFIRWLASG